MLWNTTQSHWGSYLIYSHQWSRILISRDSENSQSEDKQVCVCAAHSQYIPVLRGVGYSGNELHGFGVMVNLSVQAEILLDKIIWGHELFTILVHHAGILARRQTAPASVNPQILRRSSEMEKCQYLFTQVTQDMWRAFCCHQCLAWFVSSVIITTPVDTERVFLCRRTTGQIGAIFHFHSLSDCLRIQFVNYFTDEYQHISSNNCNHTLTLQEVNRGDGWPTAMSPESLMFAHGHKQSHLALTFNNSAVWHHNF